MQYLDRLFDYFQPRAGSLKEGLAARSDQVDASLSESHKQRVKELYAEFAAARRKGTGPEALEK